MFSLFPTNLLLIDVNTFIFGRINEISKTIDESDYDLIQVATLLYFGIATGWLMVYKWNHSWRIFYCRSINTATRFVKMRFLMRLFKFKWVGAESHPRVASVPPTAGKSIRDTRHPTIYSQVSETFFLIDWQMVILDEHPSTQKHKHTHTRIYTVPLRSQQKT